MPYCTVQYSYEYEYRVRAPHGSVTSVLTLSQALHKPSSSPLAAFTGVVRDELPLREAARYRKGSELGRGSFAGAVMSSRCAGGLLDTVGLKKSHVMRAPHLATRTAVVGCCQC